MTTNNHLGLKSEAQDDTSGLVTDKLDVDAIWAEWNRAGLQGQRRAGPAEANEGGLK